MTSPELEAAVSAGLDLEAARESAQLFISNFPPTGFPLGDVDERAARWMAQLLDDRELRARLRAVLGDAGEPPADPTQDEPWLMALQELARQELDS